MSPCLVQQLFRQKIAVELDQDLIDEVLFPMLRSRKHPSKELLLDIKLTQSADSNEYGQSAIVICRVIDPNDDVPEEGVPQNISPFEVPLGPHNLWLPARLQRLPGKIPSQMRRLRHPSMWGSIDILNELRSLKRPQIRDHPPSNQEDQFDYPGAEFVDVYLSLQGQRGWWLAMSRPAEKITDDLNFVNDYLEDALNNGKRISWGGDPTRPNNFDSVLSTYY
jgi:hypothetical protein